jgi:hypothetical protein
VDKANKGLLRSLTYRDPPVRVQFFHTHPVTGALSPEDVEMASAISKAYRQAGLDIPVDIYAIAPVAGDPRSSARVAANPGGLETR